MEELFNVDITTNKLVGFCDAAHANNLQNRQSTTAVVFTFMGGAIIYKLKTQSLTAGSLTEAEFIAAHSAGKVAWYLQFLLKDLSYEQSEPTPIYNNNQACIHWSYNNTSKGLHYIQIKENAVRENIQLNNISITHIEGKINVADIFTKENKDYNHYIDMRNTLMHFTPMYSNPSHNNHL